MNDAGKIISVNPPFAIPGGEVFIECEGVKLSGLDKLSVFFGGKSAQIIAASPKRLMVIAPENDEFNEIDVWIENGGRRSESVRIQIGRKIAETLHQVANPAVDPKDDSIILTRSGSRGQKLPITLLRLERDGFVTELPVDMMNPTGIAFDRFGELFVTNRADGEVCRIANDEDVIPVSFDLGIATGIAFDREGEMFVGDRSGTIFRIKGFESVESFAVLEPSVSAFHLAFSPDGRLFVSAPKLSSYDSIYAFSPDGVEDVFCHGLGRPQGLAFDKSGDLYVAACLEGRHGIVKISSDGKDKELIVAGMNIVGLCFTRQGEMIVATHDAIFNLPMGIYGTLLD